jgi:hypothetical protein
MLKSTSDVSAQELRELAGAKGTACVSIFMPAHRAGNERQQDPIRLKNLLAEAERRLEAQGMRTPDIQALLAPVAELTPQHNFWQQPADGLALFLAPDFYRAYHLPFEVQERVMVGGRFHLKPMLPLLRPDGQFFVLALSQNQVRLLQGSRYTVSEVDLAGVPLSLSELLDGESKEEHAQFHTSTANPGGRGGERPAINFGHGGGEEDGKADILRFFHRIDAGVREWLGPRQSPLVLAGVDYLLPLYREANSYPHLVDDGLTGNPEVLRPEELHAGAWEIVRPMIVRVREQAVEKVQQLLGAGSKLATISLAETVPAAAFSRVDTLFVNLGEQRWGRFDPEAGEVVMHAAPEDGDEDLLDLAAVQTYLNGGAVYAASQDTMPVESAVAAILRY